jgi:hypothetical protein
MKDYKECEEKKVQINCNCFKKLEYLDYLPEKDFVIEVKRLAEKIKKKLGFL